MVSIFNAMPYYDSIDVIGNCNMHTIGKALCSVANEMPRSLGKESNVVGIPKPLAALFSRFDDKLRETAEDEIPVDDFERISDEVDVREILIETTKCMSGNIGRVIDDPEIFWSMAKFASKYRLNEPFLHEFALNLLEFGLIKNEYRHEIINYYFDNNIHLDFDPWILKWVIRKALDREKRMYRIQNKELIVFAIDGFTGEFIDYLQYPAPEETEYEDFSTVTIHDPSYFTKYKGSSSVGTLVLYSLIGMLPGCRISIPVSGLSTTWVEFNRFFRAIDRSNGVVGLTSVTRVLPFFEKPRFRSLLETRISYLDVRFEGHQDSYKSLINCIGDTKPDRLRIAISHFGCTAWDSIFKEIPVTSPISNQPTVIEQLTLFDANNVVTKENLENLAVYGIERVNFLSGRSNELQFYEALASFEKLKFLSVRINGPARDGIARLIGGYPIETLALTIFDDVAKDLNSGNRVDDLNNESVLDDLSPENDGESIPYIVSFLETALKAGQLKTLIINLESSKMVDSATEAILGIIKRLPGRNIKKVVICQNNELVKTIDEIYSCE